MIVADEIFKNIPPSCITPPRTDGLPINYEAMIPDIDLYDPSTPDDVMPGLPISGYPLIDVVLPRVRQDTYGRRVISTNDKGECKANYYKQNGQISIAGLYEHFQTDHSLGYYPIAEGDTSVGTATLDFDNHAADGNQPLPFTKICAAAISVYWLLEGDGLAPFPTLSGGGQGIHLILVFNKPVPAKRVRDYLRDVLTKSGLNEGTGGVAASEVEIFPKQYQVKKGGYGNLICLPYARNSVPLIIENGTFSPLDRAAAKTVKITLSPEPPVRLVNPPPDTDTTEKTIAHNLIGDPSRVRSALSAISSEDYDIWIKIGMALKNSFGEDGLETWREWSASSDKYDPNEIADKWASFCNVHPSPVSAGTIYHYAKMNGWEEVTNSKDFKITNPSPEPTGKYNSPSTVELICAANVKARPVKWLWLGWLATGKLHILAGAPGTGKTTCAYNLAATITTGGKWPDQTTCTDSGAVLIWSGEDAVDDTIVPRLIAAGADLSKVQIIGGVKDGEDQRPFDPARDVPALRPMMEKLKPKMLIVDSIVSAVSGDTHKNGETRRGLQPLVDLGEDFGVAIFGISHFTKGTAGKDPLERVTGSLAFGALARIVLAAAKMPPGDKSGYERIFARIKSNIGPDGNGFGYSLAETRVSGIETVKVQWEGFINGNAKDLLTESEDRSAISEAKQFLRQLLEDGPKPATEVKNAAKEAGISGSTLERAKVALHIASGKNHQFTGAWVWALPPT